MHYHPLLVLRLVAGTSLRRAVFFEFCAEDNGLCKNFFACVILGRSVQGAELVSVTQPIDTHTPNGRLSLNLLTFAEFEREIVGERTRDKLAATRRQGRWQGNGVPLGYAVDHQQRLVVVPPEAELVKDIFRRYLAFDTMRELMDWIGRRGITTKKLVTRDGKQRGGRPMDRTTVYRILNNRMHLRHGAGLRIDNGYTLRHNSYICCVCANRRNQCVTPPSICGPCPSSVT